MTARLGSEYRYFGKLVLVPFRYFSIDTYRNIDIFDNTTRFLHLLFPAALNTEVKCSVAIKIIKGKVCYKIQ